MAPTRELGPWTLHGDLAYPTVTTDRFLREGDVIWVDAGINWEGYASDYGRTWITSTHPIPSARQHEHFRRWRTVVDAALEILEPGVSALRLGKTAIEANDGVRPWIDTSTWPTASAPRAPRCPSSERISVRPSMSG